MQSFTYATRSLRAVLAALSASAFAALSASASDSQPRFSDHATGDWHGHRSSLADEGIEFFAYYNAIIASNVSGGLSSETNYAGDLFAGVSLDLEKLAGWADTTLVVTGIDRHGSDITPAVGSQYSVMQLVGGQTTFLYNFTVEKLFAEGVVSVKLGRMSATDDFVGSSFYSYSLNNAVNGQIRAVLFDGVMTSYPFAVWGGRVKARLSDTQTLQIGLFQLYNSMWDPAKHGTDLSIRGDDGLSLFSQYDWTPTLAGRPARFFVGMNNAFFDIAEFTGGGTTHAFTRLYAHGDYQVYREAADRDAGLTVFATFAYTAQDEVALMPVQSTFGAHYQGLLASRPDDRTVFFVTYGGFSDDFSARRVSGGGAPAESEMVFELGHRVQLTKYAYLQPDVQFIRHPGGSGRIDDAVVLSVQFGATF